MAILQVKDMGYSIDYGLVKHCPKIATWNWADSRLFQKLKHKSSQISPNHALDVKCDCFDEDESNRSIEKTT